MMKKLMLALSLFTVVGLQAADMPVDGIQVNDQVVHHQPDTLEQRALKQLYKSWLEKEENNSKPIYYNLSYFEVLKQMYGNNPPVKGLRLIKDKEGVISFTHAEVKKIKDYENHKVKNLSIHNIIERGEVPAFSDLGYLDLSKKNISSLDGLKDIKGIEEVTDLRLNNNQLREIKEGTFTDLTNLQNIRLNNNQLTEIKEGTFTGLTHLEQIYLDNNQLTEIKEGTFAGLTNLQWIYLNNNQLTEIKEEPFTDLANLQWISLNDNQLTEIKEGTFAGLTNLQWIYLNNNQLTEIKEGAFTGLTNLKELNLGSNQLT